MEPQLNVGVLWPNCSQTVGWIKMLLDTEVGLCPGDIVLDGDPAPPRKGAEKPPLLGLCDFGPCLLYETVAHLSCC